MAVAGRCVAGKMVLTVQTKNNEDVPVSAQVSTPYGGKTVEVQAGKTSSQAFTSRLATLPPGTVSVTGTAIIDGQPVTSSMNAEYAQLTCN